MRSTVDFITGLQIVLSYIKDPKEQDIIVSADNEVIYIKAVALDEGDWHRMLKLGFIQEGVDSEGEFQDGFLSEAAQAEHPKRVIGYNPGRCWAYYTF